MTLACTQMVVFALSVALAAGATLPAEGTPAQQFAALLREYEPASTRLRSAETDQQRRLAVERLSAFPKRFVDLAEAHAADPIAFAALQQAIQALNSTDSAAQIAWESNRAEFPIGLADGSAARAIALLLRDHRDSDRLGPVCDVMRFGYRLEYETFLEAVLQTSPHRDVQGVACLSLARFLNERLRMAQLVEDRPGLRRRFEVVFGQDYPSGIEQRRRAGLVQRIEALFEQAIAYHDVSTRVGGTVAEQAQRELYDLRHLVVGRIAPDIAGQDQDGRHFRLSDYRGKVVLLYFWLEF